MFLKPINIKDFSGNNGLHQQYNVDDRMAVLANMVGQSGVPPGLDSQSSAAAIANLAMRLGVTQVSPTIYSLF